MRFTCAWLVMLMLAGGTLGACASTDLPQQTSDAALRDAGSTDVAAPDAPTPDAGPSPDVAPADTGHDTPSCQPTTCQALSACGSVDDGCGGTLDCGTCPDIGGVRLTPTGNQVLPVGEFLQLSASATDTTGADTFCQFTWSSQDPTVARVDMSGNVEGVAAGMADIRAECRGKSAKVRVYVNDSGLPAALTDPSDLAIWLRADVGLDFSGGANVEQWEDLSGNGYKVAASTFSHDPQRVNHAVNGKPVLRFSGNQDLRTTATHVALTQATIFAVVEDTDTSREGQILSNCTQDGGNNQFRFEASDSALYFYGEHNGLDQRVSVGVPTTTYQLITVVLTASQLRVLQNGQDQASVALSLQGAWNFGEVGARCSSEHLHGDIAEIMVYDTALSDADRQKVEAYLTQRYGL